MKVSSRGVVNAVLFTVCVLVLLGFIVATGWVMGEVLTGIVSGAVDTQAN